MRDSFITHRAFCDALAQESARNLNPPSMGTIGSHLFGLSQISALQPDQHHQSLSNQDILRLGGSGGTRPGTQFESLFGPGFVPPSPSSRSPPASSPAAGLFMHHQQVQNFHEDRNQSSLGMLAPNKSSSSSLHRGLMQLPQINDTSSPSSSTGFFNLSFFPCSSNAASSMDGGHHSGRGVDSTHLFSTGGLMSIPIPSMYSTSSNAIHTPTPHMSATALLQKAAQLGSTAATTTTSNNNNATSSSLLKSLGKSGPDRNPSFGYFGENNNHMHDIMNAGSSSSPASIFGGLYATDQNHDDHDHHDPMNDGEYREMFHANNINDHIDGKLVFDYDHIHDHGQHRGCDHPSGFTIDGMEEAGRLTRDFLGVGEIVRNVREFHNGVEMSAVDRTQGKSSTPSQSKSYGGGSF
ncbi:hypothetical protein OROGR_010398 [Orobanche gracilis]